MRILHGGRTGELEFHDSSLNGYCNYWTTETSDNFVRSDLRCRFFVLFEFSSNSQPCQPPATLPCTPKWSNPFGSALTTKTLQNTKLFWKHLIYRCATKPENSKVQRHPYKLPNYQGSFLHIIIINIYKHRFMMSNHLVWFTFGLLLHITISWRDFHPKSDQTLSLWCFSLHLAR